MHSIGISKTFRKVVVPQCVCFFYPIHSQERFFSQFKTKNSYFLQKMLQIKMLQSSPTLLTILWNWALWLKCFCLLTLNISLVTSPSSRIRDNSSSSCITCSLYISDSFWDCCSWYSRDWRTFNQFCLVSMTTTVHLIIVMYSAHILDSEPLFTKLSASNWWLLWNETDGDKKTPCNERDWPKIQNQNFQIQMFYPFSQLG